MWAIASEASVEEARFVGHIALKESQKVARRIMSVTFDAIAALFVAEKGSGRVKGPSPVCGD
jgi:hypothetical protein